MDMSLAVIVAEVGPTSAWVRGVAGERQHELQQRVDGTTRETRARPERSVRCCVRTLLFAMAAMLATAGIQAADGSGESEIEVRVTVYFDLSGEGEPHIMKLGREPKTFTLKIEEVEQLSLKMTPLDGCKVRIDVLGRENVTGTRPLSWPAFFEPGSTFAIAVSFPRHRQEVRGSVSGAGACSRTAPGKLLEPTLEIDAAQQ
jgi:hypothetical protein